MVSPEPIITDAAKDSKLSAPNFSSSDAKAAIEAEPENGRVITSGIIPEGTPIFSEIGDKMLAIPSAAPLELNIVREASKSVRVGRMFMVVFSPSFAPFVNEVNRLGFFKKHMHSMSIIIGIVNDDIFSSILFTRKCSVI